MSNKKNISKQIKKQILNNECDYDYWIDSNDPTEEELEKLKGSWNNE